MLAPLVLVNTANMFTVSRIFTVCYCLLLFAAVCVNPCLYPAGKYDILKLPDRQRLKKENQL